MLRADAAAEKSEGRKTRPGVSSGSRSAKRAATNEQAAGTINKFSSSSVTYSAVGTNSRAAENASRVWNRSDISRSIVRGKGKSVGNSRIAARHRYNARASNINVGNNS